MFRCLRWRCLGLWFWGENGGVVDGGAGGRLMIERKVGCVMERIRRVGRWRWERIWVWISWGRWM